MPAPLENIHAAYLTYMATHLSGTTRPQAMSGVLAAVPAALSGQVTNYLNASISGAQVFGAIDANLYLALDNRYQALGLARGQDMLRNAGTYGIVTYLQTENYSRQIDQWNDRKAVLSGVAALQVTARAQVAAASGLNAATYVIADNGIQSVQRATSGDMAFCDAQVARLNGLLAL